MQTISAEQLRAEEQRSGAVEMLDVRTPVEFRELHVPQSRNVPLDQLRPRQVMEARNGGAERPLYLLCRTGNRARKAGQQFLDAGYSNVVLVEGGVQAWEQAGLPVTRGKKAISLERQVRIVAGGLVLTGTLLGVFVHPYILALPAFVGAGLMFAGITDTCGMGMLLARMPWNRVACGKPSAGGDQSCSTAST
ncbi:MAG: rhodanese-like domain-containing protein [Pirellulaceae bacterium]|nr:rhodanese-like domain-containing protein [Pirellulaceae bacterium]